MIFKNTAWLNYDVYNILCEHNYDKNKTISEILYYTYYIGVGTGGGGHRGHVSPQYFWYIVRWFHNQLI